MARLSLERLSRRLRYGAPIIVVTGLPRSGTSMAMKMLEAGGVTLLTDGIRAPDESNPNGYFEYEPVKGLENHGDATWLRDARGKAVKVISFLFTWLPESYDYQVIFMERDLDEVIASQNTMLVRQGEQINAAAGDGMRGIYARHLQQVDQFISRRACFRTLSLTYRDTIEHPAAVARRIGDFLDRRLDIDRMAAVVDCDLYRNRR